MRPDTPPTWEQLRDEASACTRCALHEDRTQVVFGAGDPDADLVLIGEAPGRHEDLTGTPFAGAVGNLIDNLLLDNDLTREDVYLTTAVKCRPAGTTVGDSAGGRAGNPAGTAARPAGTPTGAQTGAPTDDQVDTCAPYLRAQLALLRPQVVVALGQRVTELLLGREAPIHRLAGYRLEVGGVTLIPTHDPQTALQGNGRAMAALRRDVRTAAGIVSGRVAAAGDALAELRAERPATTTSS